MIMIMIMTMTMILQMIVMMLMMMILYLKAFNADNPVFPSPWTPSDPTIRINITENIPPGQVSHNNNDDDDDSDNNTL